MIFKNPFKKISQRNLNNIEKNCCSNSFDPYKMPTVRGVNEEAAQSISQVYRCVQLISDQVQQLPIITYRVWDENKTINYNSPVYSLFNFKLNKRQTKFMFVKTMIESMLLKGNAYQYIKRDDRGVPVELVYIPSEFVLPIYNQTKFDEPVLYQVIGHDGLVESIDMIHLVLKTLDGVLGISVIRYQALTLNIAINSDENANEFFASGSNVQGVIEVPSKLTQQQKEDQLNTLRKIKESTGSSMTILEGGQTLRPITINPSDQQLIETRQFNILTLANWFGVPASKLNSKEGTTYNGVEQEQIQFLQDTIQPILYRIEDEFEKKLLSDSERIYTEIKFRIDDILRTDLATKSSYLRNMMMAGILSPNEIRSTLDLPYVNDPIMDEHFMMVNMMTTKQFAENVNLKTQQNKQNKDIADAKDK